MYKPKVIHISQSFTGQGILVGRNKSGELIHRLYQVSEQEVKDLPLSERETRKACRKGWSDAGPPWRSQRIIEIFSRR